MLAGILEISEGRCHLRTETYQLVKGTLSEQSLAIGSGISKESLKSLVKALNLWDSESTKPAFISVDQCYRTGKGQFSIPVPKKDNAKECSKYHTIALIVHANKVMLKILQDRLQ